MPSLLPLVLALALAARADTAGDPAGDPSAVVRVAVRAVEADSAPAVAAQWAAQLRRDSTDRLAALGLATLARLTYDYPSAERLYARLYAADSAQPDRIAAYARLGQAWSLEERGLSTAAGEEFARARASARTAGDSAAEGEALVGLAFPRARVGGVPVGLALLDSAERLIPDTAFAAHSERLRQRAIVLGIAGSADAMAVADTSLALARRAGVVRAEAHAVRAAGKVWWYRENTDSALAALRLAETLFRRAHDRSWAAVTALDRVNVLLARGDLGEARTTLRVALGDAAASHNTWAVATAHNGLGLAAMYLNDVVTSAAHLEKAVAMFEAQEDPSDVMKARELLTWVSLAVGDYAAARRQTLDVLAFYDRTGERLEQLNGRRRLAVIAMRERDWAAAERALAAASAFARTLGRNAQRIGDADLAYDRGRLALLRGDLDTADRSFAEYIRTLDSTQHVFRYDARVHVAEIHARRGGVANLARAERELKEAADELDAWRATLTDRELRLLAFQASPLEMRDPGSSTARVVNALATRGRAAAAFALAERQRARELSDRLAEAAALRAGHGTPTAATAARTRPTAATAQDIIAAIPDERLAVLEYVFGEGGAPTTLFVLTRAGASAYTLPPLDSVAEQTARFITLVESGADGSALARALGAALMDSAHHALPASVDRLVVIPDGPLYRVPFDALRLADGRYLVERYAVGVAPSAAVVAALWRRPQMPHRAARLLAFGDPAFASEAASNETSEAGAYRSAAGDYRSAFDATGGLPRLVGSGREAALVARYAQAAVVRRREEASAAYLKRAPLDSFRVIHLATHALVDDQTVARTALALAPGAGESGFVTPGDLAALRLTADVVVLSACRTAGGVVVRGEGVQGLTAPLLQAGARSVVATDWRIGDRSTVAFVEAFYGGLARDLPVSEALRSAKLDAIRRGAPARDWAAFTVVGDPLVRVPLRAPVTARRWWLGSLALAAAALGLYAAARARRTSGSRSDARRRRAGAAGAR